MLLYIYIRIYTLYYYIAAASAFSLFVDMSFWPSWLGNIERHAGTRISQVVIAEGLSNQLTRI
jgi:hypothetical protein